MTIEQLPLFDAIRIPLDVDITTLVDPVDADLLQYKWFPLYTKEGRIYARRRLSRSQQRRNICMHQIIAQRMFGMIPDGCEIDHINNDSLDNRRTNLRIATCSQNRQNRRIQINNTSGYRGVSYHKASGRWQAQIRVDRKRISLGCFASPIEAAEAYNKAALEHFGQFAGINEDVCRK